VSGEIELPTFKTDPFRSAPTLKTDPFRERTCAPGGAKEPPIAAGRTSALSKLISSTVAVLELEPLTIVRRVDL